MLAAVWSVDDVLLDDWLPVDDKGGDAGDDAAELSARRCGNGASGAAGAGRSLLLLFDVVLSISEPKLSLACEASDFADALCGGAGKDALDAASDVTLYTSGP